MSLSILSFKREPVILSFMRVVLKTKGSHTQSASKQGLRACAPSAQTILNLSALPICYESKVFAQSRDLHTGDTPLVGMVRNTSVIKDADSGCSSAPARHS